MGKANGKATDIGPQISAQKLQNLIKLYNKNKQETAELSGELGEQIRNLIENNHLNRKAFNMLKPLLKLEPEKLADVMEAFLYYYDASGLEERAKSAPRFDTMKVIEGKALEVA